VVKEGADGGVGEMLPVGQVGAAAEFAEPTRGGDVVLHLPELEGGVGAGPEESRVEIALLQEALLGEQTLEFGHVVAEVAFTEKTLAEIVNVDAI
jgi:hypothetical protein